VRIDGSSLDKRHQSEATMIGKDDMGRRVGFEHDMIVFASAGVGFFDAVMEGSGSLTGITGPHCHAATHAPDE
jgi:hypothetical protein